MMSKKTLKAHSDLTDALFLASKSFDPDTPGAVGPSGVSGPVGARGPDGAVMPLEMHNEIVAMFTAAFLAPRRPWKNLFRRFRAHDFFTTQSAR